VSCALLSLFFRPVGLAWLRLWAPSQCAEQARGSPKSAD
jgi:hypothetical protein